MVPRNSKRVHRCTRGNLAYQSVPSDQDRLGWIFIRKRFVPIFGTEWVPGVVEKKEKTGPQSPPRRD